MKNWGLDSKLRLGPLISTVFSTFLHHHIQPSFGLSPAFLPSVHPSITCFNNFSSLILWTIQFFFLIVKSFIRLLLSATIHCLLIIILTYTEKRIIYIYVLFVYISASVV